MKTQLLNAGLRLEGNYYRLAYSQIKKISNEEELIQFQKIQLENLLIQAYNNVPYYHKVFNKISLFDDGKLNLKNFFKIPILTKEIIRENYRELLSKDHCNRKHYSNSSGGSTGEPLNFVQDAHYKSWAIATNHYYYKDILKIDEFSSRKVILWGSERDLIKKDLDIKNRLSNWITNTILLNSFKMSRDNMHRYIECINRSKPELIRGYTGSLYELCLFADKNCINLHKPNAIICTAESLKDYMRREIELMLGPNLFNFYGSREIGCLAGECKKGLMHYFPFWTIIELLGNDNTPVEEGEEGKVIATNLFNYSMPFIRYELGDLAKLGPRKCSCGSMLPTLKGITGRITDHFYLKNGTTIPGEFFIHLIGVALNNGLIKKFKVIQEEFDRLRIVIVPDAGFSKKIMSDIEDKIRIVMGENCYIQWEFVNDIPKTNSGKFEYIKSLVKI
jgi:phenylacetate-CoA ligase